MCARSRFQRDYAVDDEKNNNHPENGQPDNDYSKHFSPTSSAFSCYQKYPFPSLFSLSLNDPLPSNLVVVCFRRTLVPVMARAGP